MRKHPLGGSAELVEQMGLSLGACIEVRTGQNKTTHEYFVNGLPEPAEATVRRHGKSWGFHYARNGTTDPSARVLVKKGFRSPERALEVLAGFIRRMNVTQMFHFDTPTGDIM